MTYVNRVLNRRSKTCAMEIISAITLIRRTEQAKALNSNNLLYGSVSSREGERVYPAYLEGRTEVSRRQVVQRDSRVSLPRSEHRAK